MAQLNQLTRHYDSGGGLAREPEAMLGGAMRTVTKLISSSGNCSTQRGAEQGLYNADREQDYNTVASMPSQFDNCDSVQVSNITISSATAMRTESIFQNSANVEIRQA
ncbi:hypothetical protein HPP92_029107 [Vanilla planifolia]|uniref:Uncharacterized protein n=1 Tax=Vanilla planifolia TaxID=51239 RepID=A0A835P5H8_VANPL|nr:hypothetical protein HPP92_029107 [Vanilla planifolia]KAG0445906.1 hypothetical protein HPP92_029096 [Vanilla planifolia]